MQRFSSEGTTQKPRSTQCSLIRLELATRVRLSSCLLWSVTSSRSRTKHRNATKSFFSSRTELKPLKKQLQRRPGWRKSCKDETRRHKGNAARAKISSRQSMRRRWSIHWSCRSKPNSFGQSTKARDNKCLKWQSSIGCSKRITSVSHLRRWRTNTISKRSWTQNVAAGRWWSWEMIW